MKIFKSLLILSALTFFLIACSQAATNTSATNQNVATNTNQTAVVTNTDAADQPEAGDEFTATRRIYTKQCASCHKENGEGGEALYNGEKVKAPSFKGRGAMNASDDRLADYIANGEEDEMPAFKDKLKPAEIKSLVKFIRKEFQGK